MNYRKKRGQVWTFDFIIGVMLFIFMLLIAVKSIQELYTPEEKTQVDKDAMDISQNILSSGRPNAWTEQNVIVPGIVTSGKIDIDKLSLYDSLNYNFTKGILGIRGEYIFYFHNGTTIQNISKCFHGYPLSDTPDCDFNLESLTYEDLYVLDRIVLINNNFYGMRIISWN